MMVPQLSAQHGPGTSGGQGNMGKKKFSLVDQDDSYMMKNPQMKRPNTIANKQLKFDGVNGMKIDGEPQQVSQKNMNEIYDMLEKYTINERSAPQGGA